MQVHLIGSTTVDYLVVDGGGGSGGGGGGGPSLMDLDNHFLILEQVDHPISATTCSFL